ncbi:MAG: hypothetical protein BGO44_03385 [Legionella sp. 39-23]|nr:MAG: hypothetical protein BGO44_03385 [Legionella sp. 39-23]
MSNSFQTKYMMHSDFFLPKDLKFNFGCIFTLLTTCILLFELWEIKCQQIIQHSIYLAMFKQKGGVGFVRSIKCS